MRVYVKRFYRADGQRDARRAHSAAAKKHWIYLMGVARLWPHHCCIGPKSRREVDMRFVWLVLALMMLFAWIGGFVVYHVAGFMIHLLLIFAVILLVIHLFSSRSSA